MRVVGYVFLITLTVLSGCKKKETAKQKDATLVKVVKIKFCGNDYGPDTKKIICHNKKVNALNPLK